MPGSICATAMCITYLDVSALTVVTAAGQYSIATLGIAALRSCMHMCTCHVHNCRPTAACFSPLHTGIRNNLNVSGQPLWLQKDDSFYVGIVRERSEQLLTISCGAAPPPLSAVCATGDFDCATPGSCAHHNQAPSSTWPGTQFLAAPHGLLHSFTGLFGA